MMKAFYDYFGFDTVKKAGYVNLDEGMGSSKTLMIEGVFAQAEKENRNKRIYPKNVLERAISVYDNTYIKNKTSMGELNHPQTPYPNPERACILVTELHWDNNDVHGKARVLSTPMGKTVEALINDGVQLGISTRGIGELTEKSGVSYVGSDYIINAFDIVSCPSGIDCWVNGILEHFEYSYNESGVLVESVVDGWMKNKKFGDTKKLAKDFESFISSLNLC